MITTTYYHTESGSTYEVKLVQGAIDCTYVRRRKLGEKHTERGAEQVAKRKADGIDDALTKVRHVNSPKVGERLVIKIHDGDYGTIYTSTVTEIEDKT